MTTLLALALATAAAAQKTTATCTIQGLPQGVKVVVNEARGGKLVPVDTLALDAKGRFKVQRELSQPFLAALTLTQERSPMLHLMMLPGEKITLGMTYMPSINFVNITESKGSENMALYRQYTDLVSKALVEQQPQSIDASLAQLVGANPATLMSAFLVTYFEQSFEQHADLYKQVRDALIKKYPDHDLVRHIDGRLKSAILPGMEAPDIVMNDPQGKERRLSDLRGKVVLIDFWASWCRPCRMENPNVVRLYSRYRDLGFEVFSVSLDKDSSAWVNAIAADHLDWPNHVSDLRYWSSAAGRLYGIQSIPATVLVGADGKIIARNLRGAELENKLKEIFNQ